jgi:hypothetical protein
MLRYDEEKCVEALLDPLDGVEGGLLTSGKFSKSTVLEETFLVML